MSVKEAAREMGIENKDMYTIGELETIAEKANCTLLDVMRELRR